MTSTLPALHATYRPISSISPAEVLTMHRLFSGFYENADVASFLRDLSEKDGALLLRERCSGELRGFSTIKKVPLWDGHREVIGVFSGDTILEPAFWGDRTLKDAFARYMATQKLKSPTVPLYWLLISKGYKTYLLLANNFIRYFPRHDQSEDPKLATLVEAYCNKLFPGKYDREAGVLDFGDGCQRLSEDVAPISSEMRLNNPAINYFERRNPEWRRGVELPCIAEVTLANIVLYLQKERRKIRGVRAPESVPPVARPSGIWTTDKTQPAPAVAEPLRRSGTK